MRRMIAGSPNVSPEIAAQFLPRRLKETHGW
jgi:hypothetical protein